MKGKVYVSYFSNYNEKIIYELYEGGWNYENYVITIGVGLLKKKTINLASDLCELFTYSEESKQNHAFVEGLNSTDKGFDKMLKFGNTNVIAGMVAGSIIKKKTINRILGSVLFNATLSDGSVFKATTDPSIFKELAMLSNVKVLDNNDDELTKKEDTLLLSPKNGWKIK